MSTAEFSLRLTPAQVEFYHVNGFLALPSLVEPDEVTWIREVYDRLFAERAGREVGDQFDLAGSDEEGREAALPQILNPARYAPELLGARFRPHTLTIARQLLGPGAEYRGEHAIFKPARVGAETPWHQDEAYWNPALDYQSISVWIPLQEVTRENGCMEFIPGSHRLEVLPHHSIGYDSRVHGLEIDPNPEVDLSTAVACPLPAGGCTIHHYRTLHFTGANRSPIARRAYILGFSLPPVEREQPREFLWNQLKQTPREERAQRAARKPDLSAESAGEAVE
jgi:ectoine hydroxylase-related dioxygenase (phytanoyl-CoA dioxygenase family)